MLERRATAVGTSEQDALSRLYESEYRSLMAQASLIVGDRAVAEDLVHDAFLALQRKFAVLDDQTTAAGYLRVSVINGARSWLRHQGVRRRYLTFAAPRHVEDGADISLLTGEDHRAIAAAVRNLPRRQQQVVVLRYWSGMSEQEIAECLNISTGTVKSTASRALKSLARKLGEPL